MGKQELIDFESDIASLFLDKKILFPCHLSKGNEDFLIEIFKEIKSTDWVFSTHRNHYHALLHGFPPDELKKWIIKNGSMHVYKERFFTSGIVGGILPIAVGVAMGIKRRGGEERVWCFIGDMGASTGICAESLAYAGGKDLPIKFIIEDNGFSVDTPTCDVWGTPEEMIKHIKYYHYERGYPHQGAGTFILF